MELEKGPPPPCRHSTQNTLNCFPSLLNFIFYFFKDRVFLCSLPVLEVADHSDLNSDLPLLHEHRDETSSITMLADFEAGLHLVQADLVLSGQFFCLLIE